MVPDARTVPLGELAAFARRRPSREQLGPAAFVALNVTDGMRARAAGMVDLPPGLAICAARVDLADDLNLNVVGVMDNAQDAAAAMIAGNVAVRQYAQNPMVRMLGLGPDSRSGRAHAPRGRASTATSASPPSGARGWPRSCWRSADGRRRRSPPSRARDLVVVNPAMSSSLHVRRSGPLRGTCRVPGDKSISHRALLFGALCDGVVEATGLGQGGDNLSTAAALRALGVDVQLEAGQARIAGVGFAGLHAAAEALDCGNSGTTIRLLLGLLAGRPFETEMRGDASLTRRPMGRVAAPLRQMGATIEGRSDPARPGDIYPPLRVAGRRAHRHRAPAEGRQRPAQERADPGGAAGARDAKLREPARSRDHTERMLGFLGAPIATLASGEIVVDPTGWNGRLKATALTIPGDLSSATFLIVAALVVPGSDVVIEKWGSTRPAPGRWTCSARWGPT